MVITDNVLKSCYLDEETVEVTDGVVRISSFAFAGRGEQRADKIEKIILPDSVKYINESAFKGCNVLEEVYIGKGIVEIGDTPFKNCYSLNTIYYAGTEEEWNAIRKISSWYKTEWSLGATDCEIIFLGDQ
jgi:hypothetical protein